LFLSGGQTTLVLVLQFLEAGTLEKNLNTPYWIQRRLEWLLQVVEAVAYIYSKTVIHCDMLEFPKPRYARPRLRPGEKPDVKDDIFALEIAALFRNHIYLDLQQLSPPGLGEIIRCCWSERYAVIEQVVCDPSKVLLDFAGSALRPELRHWCLSTKLLLTISLFSIFALYIFLSA
ncbi:hypothetical protein DL98DRAFT_523225, partial [Cadophora sp. DSE1049]